MIWAGGLVGFGCARRAALSRAHSMVLRTAQDHGTRHPVPFDRSESRVDNDLRLQSIFIDVFKHLDYWVIWIPNEANCFTPDEDFI